jgi:hypothetical protein
MSRVGKVLVMLVVLGCCVIAGGQAYNLYVWHQIEKQALAADLVEGEQE